MRDMLRDMRTPSILARRATSLSRSWRLPSWNWSERSASLRKMSEKSKVVTVSRLVLALAPARGLPALPAEEA